MDIVMNVVNFVKDNWEKVLVLALVFQTFIKGLRDAVDSTPETDDNIFEKFCTLSTKVLGYLIGIRAKK